MDDVNTIQYCIPGNTEIKFGILSQERHVSLKLLAGAAVVYMGDRQVHLCLGEEFPLPIWESLSPILKSRIECEFICRGNHYVYNASTKMGSVWENLFSVSLNDDEPSYVFVLEKYIQLQIFVSEIDLDYQVSITAIRGQPEIFGQKLLTDESYFLPADSSFLVNSSDDNPYSVNIRGYKRRIRVFLIESRLWGYMKGLHNRIHDLRLKSKKHKLCGPTIVVTGPKNAGKTSFCHFLLNKAIEDGMNPAYIDLNVHGNSNTIPGAMSFLQIQCRRHITLSFSYCTRHVLQFGYVNVDSSNFRLYSLLIGKMGELLTSNQVYNYYRFSGAIVEIDTCGNIFQDCSTIDCVLESFSVDLVVFIGHVFSYDNLKNTVLRTAVSEFVPWPESFERRQNHLEGESLDRIIRKRLTGIITRPTVEHNFTIKFDVFQIYEIRATPFLFNNRNPMNANLHALNVMPVIWNPSIEYSVLAVCRDTMVYLGFPVTPVKHYVIFTKIDMENKSVTLISPSPDIVSGGLLLLSSLTISRV